jgi:hypothetical protein
LQEEFIGKLDAIRVVDREHGESAETIGDLEDAVRIANEFPYSLVPGWRFALITALAAGLSLQLLYFWGILKTLETSSRERSSERAWVFLHEGRLAALLGFLWLTGPSFLLYCAVAQWVEHDRFETWRSPLGVGWCWTVVAGSLFVWNACHELRQEYFSDKGRMQ